MILVASGCGLTEAKYIDYSDDEGASDGGDDGATECPDAEAAFASQVQPVVKSTCATAACHKITTIAGKTLSPDDATNNRAQLKAYTGTTSDKIINKIGLKTTPQHGGGDQSAALPKANVDAWLAKEATCP
jgi:hypothetical protein